MREIKFRGKRTDDGEWVYGNLVRMKTSERYGEQDVFSNTWIVEIVDELEMRAFSSGCAVWTDNDFIQVDSETVSQFTDLKDKNGKEIYEGDEFHLGDPRITYTVVWHDTGFMGKQNGANSFVGLSHWKNRIEIIGNIYEGKYDN